jgi:hypothetical protein
MKITRAYRIEGEAGYRVIKYFHNKTDGLRLKHHMTTKSLPRMVLLKHPPDQCQLWTRIRVPETKLVGSPFLKLVTLFLCHTRHMKETPTISTSIIVSTREKLPQRQRYKSGCFVRMAFTNVDINQSPQGILDAHATSIQKVRESSKLLDNLTERAYYMYTNYTFNKWMLDTVNLSDGRTMRLYRGGARTTLKHLLAIKLPIDIKCIAEGDGVWTLLVNPYFCSLRSNV